MIEVEVVYAWADQSFRVPLSVRIGCTAQQAVLASDVLSRVNSAKALDEYTFSVYGQPVDAGYRVRDGDQIAVLRALIIDPKTARKLRVKR